ncbi:hypothetical protein BZG21_13715, partial [Escherichia coli]|nr:hypothetical protein [Escherichia coli]
LRQKQKKLIMLPSETMIWQPEFTDKTLSRKPGAVHHGCFRTDIHIPGKNIIRLSGLSGYRNRGIFQRLTAKQSIKKHVFSSWTLPVHKAATNSPTASETLADLHTDKRQQ